MSGHKRRPCGKEGHEHLPLDWLPRTGEREGAGRLLGSLELGGFGGKHHTGVSPRMLLARSAVGGDREYLGWCTKEHYFYFNGLVFILKLIDMDTYINDIEI